MGLECGKTAVLEVAVETAVGSRPHFGGFGDDPPPRMSYAPAEKFHLRSDLERIRTQPVSVPIGVHNRVMEISCAPDVGEAKGADFNIAQFTYEDPVPMHGMNPYWIRVLQTDMEVAWTSPIYVRYNGD